MAEPTNRPEPKIKVGDIVMPNNPPPLTEGWEFELVEVYWSDKENCYYGVGKPLPEFSNSEVPIIIRPEKELHIMSTDS